MPASEEAFSEIDSLDSRVCCWKKNHGKKLLRVFCSRVNGEKCSFLFDLFPGLASERKINFHRAFSAALFESFLLEEKNPGQIFVRERITYNKFWNGKFIIWEWFQSSVTSALIVTENLQARWLNHYLWEY